MAINILVESSFKDSIWCRQLLRSISDEAAARRYEVNVIPSDNFGDIDLETLFCDCTERRLLFCICTSIKTLPHINELIAQKNIHLVLINHTFFNHIKNYSCISMDFAGAVNNIVRYLISAGRNKIALYGVNPNSNTDVIKMLNFNNALKEHLHSYDESSIFYNHSSLRDCYESFEPKKEQYNAIICANDIVAISLLNYLKASGVKVPEDHFVISFGDTVLSKIYSPSVTNTSVDLIEIGHQVVYLYSYLKKREPYVSASIAIHSNLFARGSTDGFSVDSDFASPQLPFGDNNSSADTVFLQNDHSYAERYSFYHNINFYDDPEAAEILGVEDLLCAMNAFDFEILSALLSFETTAQAADRLYSSQQSIAYRIKRMCQIIGCNNKTQLLEILTKYISYESIKNYKPNSEYRI